jgi:hypothetical protein
MFWQHSVFSRRAFGGRHGLPILSFLYGSGPSIPRDQRDHDLWARGTLSVRMDESQGVMENTSDDSDDDSRISRDQSYHRRWRRGSRTVTADGSPGVMENTCELEPLNPRNHHGGHVHFPRFSKSASVEESSRGTENATENAFEKGSPSRSNSERLDHHQQSYAGRATDVAVVETEAETDAVAEVVTEGLAEMGRRRGGVQQHEV